MARKTTQDPSETTDSVASSVEDVALPADSGAAIYRDKSGQPFSTMGSEGAANIGAVTAAARAILPEPDAA